jgi:hypothetical protein
LVAKAARLLNFLDKSQVSGTREFLLVAKDRGRMGDFLVIFFLVEIFG